jgi:serine/threonine protein kinase
MSLEPGEVINNRYRIVKMLGQGGFGAVYRAWDTNFNMPCALKENLETRPQAQRQFEREARMLRGMKHPNLPLVTDYFILEGKGQYLVMDFVEGQDLQQMLEQQGGALPEAQVLDWVCQICDALVYLHSQKPPIIHRDIKPANIRITPQGEAMLVDFGIAKLFDPKLETTTGARAVTPGYAPFEQYGQGVTDQRTDIYALGATLYALLTGQRPAESIQRTIKDGLAPPQSINPHISGRASAAIHRALEMDPDKRFQSAAEFKQALSGVAQPGPEVVAPVARTLVAPIGQPAYHPAVQPSMASKTNVTRLGVLGGVGLLGLGAVAALVVFGMFFFILGKSGKSTVSPTPYALATGTGSGAGMLNGQGTATVETHITQTSPPQDTQLAQTLSPLVTSTLFQSVEKPADIPVMSTAQNLQVYKLTEQNLLGVNYEIDATVDEIVAYYEAQMPANGWKKTTSYSNEKMLGIYYQKDRRVAMVFITQSGSQLMVTIQIAES